MATAVPDLWPGDIGESSLVTPVAILKEQATALGAKTGQLVTAEVYTTSENELFFHRFFLVAPALDYKYKLLTVWHPISFYPMVCSFKDVRTDVSSQDEFVEWLRRTLTSEETKAVVRALIAQSRA